MKRAASADGHETIDNEEEQERQALPEHQTIIRRAGAACALALDPDGVLDPDALRSRHTDTLLDRCPPLHPFHVRTLGVQG